MKIQLITDAGVLLDVVEDVTADDLALEQAKHPLGLLSMLQPGDNPDDTDPEV